MKVIGVVNRKGGVGKTTVSVNLAAALMRLGPVALVDADPQASAAEWLGAHPPFPVVRASSIEALGAAMRRGGPGVMVVDAPPLDVKVTQAVVAAAALVVVPVLPSPLDVRAAAPLLRLLKEGRRRGLVVLSAVHGQARVTTDARRQLEAMGVPVAAAEITRRTAHIEAALAGLPVVHHAPGSLAAAEVRDFAAEVAVMLEG